MKRMVRGWAGLRAGALALAMVACAVARADAYTLIVAPARYSVLQVAFDLLARTPAVLVSYQGGTQGEEPVLHAWNGSDWALVTLKDYREVNFLQQVPERTVLIGDDSVLPSSIVEASSWSSEIVRIRGLDTSSLVNEFGHALRWKSSDWKWFATRYNLTLRDEAEERRQSSWYTRTGPLPGRPQLLDRITKEQPEEVGEEPAPVEVFEAAPAPDVVPAAPAAPEEPAAAPSVDPALDVVGDPDASLTK